MNAAWDLGIVVPVFNEEDHVEALISDWNKIFASYSISYRFFIVNDGSTDRSLERMESMQNKSFPIEIFSQSNKGHGPAILHGYAKALDAAWVFQIDADHQFDVSAFDDLWRHRNAYDFLIAERVQKNASIPRNAVSVLSSFLVQQIFGRGVRDVNSPYRLFRSSLLAVAISKISDKSFAPNILLTAYFVFKQTRIYVTSVKMSSTATLRKSKMSSYLFNGSLMSLFQTIAFRFRL